MEFTDLVMNKKLDDCPTKAKMQVSPIAEALDIPPPETKLHCNLRQKGSIPGTLE